MSKPSKPQPSKQSLRSVMINGRHAHLGVRRAPARYFLSGILGVMDTDTTLHAVLHRRRERREKKEKRKKVKKERKEKWARTRVHGSGKPKAVSLLSSQMVKLGVSIGMPQMKGRGRCVATFWSFTLATWL